MTQYDGRISKFQFHPMVEVVHSSLDFWVSVPDLGHEIMFTEDGSIEQLAARFGFKIVNAHEWDFSGFIGRKCRVNRDEQGFRFGGFITHES